MTEFSHCPSDPVSELERCSSGLVFVTPLSPENRAETGYLREAIKEALSEDVEGVEEWEVPHEDITHGRLVKMDSGLTRVDFEIIVSKSAEALRATAESHGNITAVLDSVKVSKEAVFAQATTGLEAIAALRRRVVDSVVSIPGVNPSTKGTFVHTTIGRPKLGVEEFNVDAVERAIEKVRATGNHRPISQEIGEIVLAEETQKYVLRQRERVGLPNHLRYL